MLDSSIILAALVFQVLHQRTDRLNAAPRVGPFDGV